MAVSLRIILGMLIFFTTIVVALIAFLPTYFAGVKAVDSTISDIRSSYVERCESSVDVFLELPLTRLRQAANFFASGIPNNTFTTTAAYEKYITTMIWSEREFFSTGTFWLREGTQTTTGDSNGEFMYIDSSLTEEYPIIGTDTNRTFHSNTSRTTVTVVRAVDPVTMETVPYFVNQNVSGNWTGRHNDVATTMYDDLPELKAAPLPRVGFQFIQPVLDAPIIVAVGEIRHPETGSLDGLVTINSKFDKMQDLMKNLGLRERSRGVAFSIHPAMVVMGLSWEEDTYRVDGNPFDVSNYGDAVKMKWFNNLTEGGFLLTEVVPTLGMAKLTDRSYVNYNTTINTKEEGPTYVNIVTVKKVNLDLRVLLAMPESDFMEGISKARSAALGGTIGAIVLTLVVAFIFASIITAPLVRLQERMSLAARFEDTEADDPRSVMGEVAGMQESYQKMRNELNRAKPYLPQSILNKEDEDDEGEMERGSTARYSVARTSLDGKSSNPNHQHRGSVSLNETKSSRSKRSTTYRVGGVSTRSGAVVPTGLNFSTAVTNKRVSVVVFNLREFALSHSPSTLADLQKKQLACVSKHVKEYKGNVDFFQGDFIQCSFNAVKGCAAHLRCSLQAALAVLADMSSQAMMPVCTAGMSSGIASVGNMGTEEMRRFCIVGHVVQQAILLERLNKSYGTKLLAPEQSIVEVASEYLLCGVDVVQLPRGSTKSAAPLLMVEVVGRANSGEMDEWMYELERGAQDNPFHSVNAAFRHLLDGEQKLAKEELAKVEVRSTTGSPKPESDTEEATLQLSPNSKKKVEHRMNQYQEQVKDSKERAQAILDRLEADPTAPLHPPAGWLDKALIPSLPRKL